MVKLFQSRRGVLAWVSGVAATVLLLSSWNAAWATPAQDVLRQTAPTPTGGQTVKGFTSAGGTLSSPAGDVVVSLPPGATTININVIYTPMSPAAAPAAPPEGMIFGSAVFTLEAYEDVAWRPGFQFAKPITITIKYTAADLALACNDPSNFVVQYYDPQKKAWVSLPTTYDAATMTATAVVDHFCWFALMVKKCLPVPAALPVTGSGGLLVAELNWGWGVLGAIGVGSLLTWVGRARR